MEHLYWEVMAFLPKSGHFGSKFLVIALNAAVSTVLYERQSAAIHFAIVRLIRWYGCVLVLEDGAANVHRMRAASPAASFFTGGGSGSLWIGKASPLASDSETRGALVAMSCAVAML